MIELKGKKEFFWDDFIIDTDKTTAKRVLHHPTRHESVFTFDAPWEGDGCGNISIVYDDVREIYILYYTAWQMLNPKGNEHTLSTTKLCCIESKDGFNWSRPNLGIVEFDGSYDNNIIMLKQITVNNVKVGVGAYFVMKDTNPEPEVRGRFKLLVSLGSGEKFDELDPGNNLCAFVSDDGHHFEYSNKITSEGGLDSVNTVYWHEEKKQYICYLRHHHLPGGKKGEYVDCPNNTPNRVRDIRVLYSKDFIEWTKPEHLNYNDDEDMELYTNNISPYVNGGHILVGFPMRYNIRREWTKNYERLCGYEKRLARAKVEDRFGLAVTDGMFMCSRDGKNWTRYKEAFLPPSPEHPSGWVYGDSSMNAGLIKTKSLIEGADDELSFYVKDGHWMGVPATLPRYTIRQDGFLGMRAGAERKKLVTKEFTFTGNTLLINFETSAYGCLYVKLIAQTGESISSCEIFGNKIDRIVDFDGEVSDFAGKTVHLEFELCDAEIYAFGFSNENS